MKVYWKKPYTDNVLSMLTPHIAERKFQSSYTNRVKWPQLQPNPCSKTRNWLPANNSELVVMILNSDRRLRLCFLLGSQSN